MSSPALRFAAIGLNHQHIFPMSRTLLAAGAELAAYHAVEDDLAAAYGAAFPQARRVADVQRILDDPTIPIVLSAAIPDERAAVAMTAMRHGKDVMVDKPGVITLRELRERRVGQGRRAHRGGRHRPRRPHDGARAAPARQQSAAGLVLRAASL